MFDQSLFSFSSLQKIVSKATYVDWLLAGTFLLGCFFIVYGFSLLILSQNQSLLVSADGGEEILVGGDTTPHIIVDVGGAVESPGLYETEVGTRIGQLLEKAGGLTKNADSIYVTKQMQLASVANDGDKIYVPFIEDQIKTSEKGEIEGSAPSDIDAKVSINDASISELTSLPGIGEKRAEDIVANRPYRSLNDLISKEVLTESLFSKVSNTLKL